MKAYYRPFSILIVLGFLLAPFIHTFAAEESFLLINGTTDAIVTELGPNINKQMSPCSTFKIPLSLMGYDALVLKDETNPIWDFQEGMMIGSYLGELLNLLYLG